MEGAGQRAPRHGRGILWIWIVLSAIAVPLVIFVLGPHLPPGKMSSESTDQTNANTVMTALLTPILLIVIVYFVYSLIVFRAKGDTVEDGEPIRGHGPTTLFWIVLTSVIVLSLAFWGSYTLVESARGAGGGQGPSPAFKPEGVKTALPIQVIGQQWNWTFRFPTYHAFETRELEIPVNQVVAFHVTSLDVTHSFWAYELGVKADAVPGVDNIAYVRPRKTGRFMIRCAELCGLWHGHMALHGRVVSQSDFHAWAVKELALNRHILPYLGPFQRVYVPEPKHRAG
jgi:cytochrome c oxidase subunit 2